MKKLEQTWRWFGPDDPVSLTDIRQAGATGIVSALHHIPNGAEWPREEILERKHLIEAAGMQWSVVESIPVHEDIKKRTGYYERYIENYQRTIRNLAQNGIQTVCYNFMPVLDWTRTELTFPLPDGSTSLRFDMTAFAAFDSFLLERSGAKKDYPKKIVKAAEERFDNMRRKEKDRLTKNILAGLPGAEEEYSIDDFQEVLDEYKDIDAKQLQKNLIEFLKAIVPVAEETEVNLAIHPDDPPFSLLGLPRVVSNAKDLDAVFKAVKSPRNGLCLCTGSLGVDPDNDLPKIAKKFAKQIHFAHLRNIKREEDGSFYECPHLDGDVDMYAVMRELVTVNQKRDIPIPMRPDHGQRILDDLEKEEGNPGYSAIGRLRGLAELRGLELGILRGMK